MSKDPFSKLQSSLSLEDLLAQPSTRNSQNWLLTYLDVFVLIVMLVITLITLSDINTEQQAAAPKKTPACPPTRTPAVINCPPTPVVENKPMQQSALPKTSNLPDYASVAENKPIQQPALPKASNLPGHASVAENKPIQQPALPKASNLPGHASVAENKPMQQPASTESKPDSPEVIIKSEVTNSIPPSLMPEFNSAAENFIPELTTANSVGENTLEQQLTKKIDEFGLNKAVNIKVTQGYAQLEIQDKVLFKSSEADLTAAGETLLKRLIPLLKPAVGLILIEGHTDNIPIKTAQFPSNWELGSSRAASVLHFLVSQQLDSSHLRAITYADTMPIADNSTAEGREKNRRVNILVKLSEQ